MVTTVLGYFQDMLFLALMAGVMLPGCCSTGGKAVVKTDLAPLRDVVVPVSGRFKVGHACPISATTAFTADHMVSVYGDMGRSRAFPLIFSQGGTTGSLDWIWSDIRRDLALVRTRDSQFEMWLKRTVEPPAIGEEVVLVGFNWNDMSNETEVAKILNVVAGMLILSKTPGPGSSGSCVMDKTTGALLGINFAGMDTKYGVRGMAWNLYGKWGEDPGDDWAERAPQ